MKRFIAFFAFLLIAVAAFCQQDSTLNPVTEVPVPTDIVDIFANLNKWFGSTFGVAGLTIFLTVFVVKLWKTITPILKQVVALVLALILMAVGNLLNIGFMAQFDILSTITYGITAGFIANGFYDLKNAFKSTEK